MYIPLSAEKILALQNATHKIAVTVVESVDSTNTYLLNQAHLGINRVCLAEAQTAGRGQREKIWQSPAKINIYCSLLWFFTEPAQALAGLSLAAGVAVAKTLQYFALPEIGLKWPNDIWQAQQKIAGVLVEIVSTPAAGNAVVVGIGLNVNVPQHDYSIEQAWTCMAHAAKQCFDRNQVASVLLDNLLASVCVPMQLPGLLKEWSSWDVLRNKKVMLDSAGQHYYGIARGIDKQGYLIIELDGKLHTFNSGSVSLLK